MSRSPADWRCVAWPGWGRDPARRCARSPAEPVGGPLQFRAADVREPSPPGRRTPEQRLAVRTIFVSGGVKIQLLMGGLPTLVPVRRPGKWLSGRRKPARRARRGLPASAPQFDRVRFPVRGELGLLAARPGRPGRAASRRCGLDPGQGDRHRSRSPCLIVRSARGIGGAGG